MEKMKGDAVDSDRTDRTPTVEGTSRREFLKKTGVAAGAAMWTVPTMQIINMAAAGAHESGTSIVTTTNVSPCQQMVKLRLKAQWTDDGYQWTTGVDDEDCIAEGFDDEIDPAATNLPIFIEGDTGQAKVTHDLFPNCVILAAYHKAGSQNRADACHEAEIGDEGLYAEFAASDMTISQVELLVECCADDL